MRLSQQAPTDEVVPGAVAVEDIEIELLLEGIHRVFGYDFRGYARPSVKRRLNRLMAKEGVTTISELQGKVLRDGHLIHAVASALSIQVSSLFRDPAFYAAFRRKAVPLLKTYPSVRIWHAGCATGEEVYSMAILLSEEGLLNKCRIYATDVNAASLEFASRGIYPAAQIAGAEHDYSLSGGTRSLSQYFEIAGTQAQALPYLQDRITFFSHNLVTDTTLNEFNAILCRNVLIYFTKALQDRVHQLLYESLVRFGILGLGANETLHLTVKEKHYRSLDETARLYRRTD